MLRRRLAAAVPIAALGTSLAACDGDREGGDGTQQPSPGAEDPADDGPPGGNPASGGTDNGSGTGSGRGTP